MYLVQLRDGWAAWRCFMILVGTPLDCSGTRRDVRSLSALGVGQGLQAVIGITLQSKQETPGVLLLAAPDRRQLRRLSSICWPHSDNRWAWR